MIDAFFPETSALYQSLADLIPFKITSIVLEPQKESIEEISRNESSLGGVITAIGKRLDGTSSSVYILIPLGKEVNVGDYVLAKEHQNYYLFVQKIYSPKIKNLDIIENSHRFVPHWLKDRISFGYVYNENVFYNTFTHSFLEKYQEESEYLKKRFFDYPSLNVYHTSLDVFQYDNVFEDLLEGDLSINNKDSKFVFENCENPIDRTSLLDQDDFNKHPFRTDPLFDFWREGYSEDLVLIENSKLEYSSFLSPNKSRTDSYPNPFRAEITKFFVADKIIKRTTDTESPYDYEPFKSVEYWEARVGRNQIVLSRDSFRKGISFFKTQADQGLFMIFDLEDEFYNLRLKSLYSSILLEEYKNYFNRFHVGLKRGNYFEIYEDDDLSSIHSQILISEEIFNLKNNGIKPENYAYLILSKNKGSFKRLGFEEAGSEGYSFTLSTNMGGNKSYINSISSPFTTLIELTSKKDPNLATEIIDGFNAKISLKTNDDFSRALQIINGPSANILLEAGSILSSKYAKQVIDGFGGKITIEVDTDIKIIIDSEGIIQILAGEAVIATFSKAEQTITFSAAATDLVINGWGVSTNKDVSVAGKVMGNKFVGQLNCVGTVVAGASGTINVVCT